MALRRKRQHAISSLAKTERFETEQASLPIGDTALLPVKVHPISSTWYSFSEWKIGAMEQLIHIHMIHTSVIQVVRIIDEHHARTTTTSASGHGSARRWGMLLEE